jgi:hypothetical protein
MNERGILMTPENYTKCDNGSKTMTRRIVKDPDELTEFLEPFVQQVVLSALCPYGQVGETVPIINAEDRSQRFQAELLDVRVERLQDCSSDDAVAEGAGTFEGECLLRDKRLTKPQLQYAALWESIHGPGSWDLNPWVWVIAYRSITP